jgi:hypothetical protein
MEPLMDSELVSVRTAWLITLEDHTAGYVPEIVSVIDSRRGREWVKQYVEQLYVDRFLSLAEKLACAKHRSSLPYRAQSDLYGRIDCGHSPFLYARKVQNVRAAEGLDGSSCLKWDDIDWAVICG